MIINTNLKINHINNSDTSKDTAIQLFYILDFNHLILYNTRIFRDPIVLKKTIIFQIYHKSLFLYHKTVPY